MPPRGRAGESGARAWDWVLFQVGVQPVQGFVTQVVGPARGTGAAFDDQVEVTGFAGAGAVAGSYRSTLRIES